MNPLVVGLGVLGLGYVAYKALSPEEKKAASGGAPPPLSQDTLPKGVKLGKSAAGGDLPYFEGKHRDLVLLALLRGQVAPTDATKPNGPLPIVSAQPTLPSAFAFAQMRSNQGLYVFVPALVASKLQDNKPLTGSDAQIVAASNPFEIGMYASSGWASVAAPGELDWSLGMSDDEIAKKLEKSADFLPSAGWKPVPTPAALSAAELDDAYVAWHGSQMAGSLNDLVFTVTIENAEKSRTTVRARLVAEPGLVEGTRIWPVEVLEQPSYPRPETGTVLEVPDVSILKVESVEP